MNTTTETQPYEFNGFTIQPHMLERLQEYIKTGCELGGFLTAVLHNDLREALSRADKNNLANIWAFVGYLHNEAPAPCWGSPEKVKAWRAKFVETETAQQIDDAYADGEDQAAADEDGECINSYHPKNQPKQHAAFDEGVRDWDRKNRRRREVQADTPSLVSCDEGTGEGRFHGRM